MKPRTSSPLQPWQRGEAARPARTRGQAAAGGHGGLLSADQKATLCQLARQAFDHQDALGLIDVAGSSDNARFQAWRRAEQLRAVGIDSLTECRNSHYRTLRGHFNVLLGREDKGFRDFTRTGRVRDRGPVEDTHEAREMWRKKILDELLAHGRRCDPASPDFDAAIACVVKEKGRITAHYIVQIAKRQNAGKDLGSLPADKLRLIYYTCRNRIAAREGRGETADRNKGQRGKKQPSKHDFTPDR